MLPFSGADISFFIHSLPFYLFYPLNLQNPGSVSSGTSKLSPLPHEPHDRGATTVDIPLEMPQVDWIMKKFKRMSKL